ncbi:hypothetical protein P4U90_08375 [Cytobacillus kochii]|uniref:hypothetical protein n=1 Tax=Cytobacillus kochii TaxID=859143 RepID=UPI002E1B69B4|nr:hypothetical protein [Cytobacillus kochii]
MSRESVKKEQKEKIEQDPHVDPLPLKDIELEVKEEKVGKKQKNKSSSSSKNEHDYSSK